MSKVSPPQVSAVVCTKDSIAGIEQCLKSLREAGIGDVIVVDANSVDGTLHVAKELGDRVLIDEGKGLGAARNLGIAVTTGKLILNMGSDNVLLPGQLERMIDYLERGQFQGVSAQTRVVGENYVARGLNAWRRGRFSEGQRAVIGTPTLFDGDLLRAHPYLPECKYSDDSELCERWARSHGAKFAISDAVCLEIGKADWRQVKIRAKMYGVSDNEIYVRGSGLGWSLRRKLKSLFHPLIADLLTPLKHNPFLEGVRVAPFLAVFTGYRYLGWIQSSLNSR